MTSLVFALIAMIGSPFDATVISEGVKAGGTVVACNGKGADIETASGICIIGLDNDKVRAVDAKLQAMGLDTSGCIHGKDGICLM